MPDLILSEIAADDEQAVADWHDIVCAVHDADRPGDPPISQRGHATLLSHPWPGQAPRAFLARAGERPVGWYLLGLSTTENLDTAPTEIEVLPDARGRGIGRAILDEAGRQVRELARARLVLEAVTDSPGAALLASAGARAVLADTQRMLDVTAIDDGAFDAMLKDAHEHATDYSLVQWAGATPEEQLAGVGALESRMTTDAPFDDLVWEQEVFDAERIRARDEVKKARGMRTYTSAARHDATGALAGVTTLTVHDGVDGFANQWETIVLPDHRGHRLGMLLKIENLRHLLRHEPAVTRIDTWNADSNAPMLAVNVAMGFTPVRRWNEWELVL